MQTDQANLTTGAIAPATGSAAPLPSRLVGRFLAEILLAAVSTLTEALEVHCGRSVTLDRSIVLMVIMRAGPHFHGDSTSLIQRPGDPARAISVNAVAASLNRPFETVRRHVNALVAAEICVRTRRGIVMRPDPEALPTLYAAIRRLHDLLALLIDYARAHRLPLPAGRPDLPYLPSATVAATLDLTLAASEYLDLHYEDWLEMVIVNAVIAANARPITFDPVLARRYASVDAIPPESLRTPVAVTQIARTMGIPYSTVQRQVNRSIDRGQLKRVPGGIIATVEHLDAGAVRIAGPAATARAVRAFARLVPGGFRFATPADCYLGGPPTLLDFGNGPPGPVVSSAALVGDS